jgi:hypothetical protein
MKIQPEKKSNQAQGRSPVDPENAFGRQYNSVINLDLLVILEVSQKSGTGFSSAAVVIV